MSKKHRIPPRPQLPGKMEHYSRITSEDTTDGLSAILAESVRIARRAYNKHQIGSIDLIDSAYGKRRREAIRNTFSAIRNHLCFTEKTKGQVTASEIWSNLNQYTHHPIEQLDEDDYLLLAASIWLLDHIEDTHALKNLLSSVTWEEDWGIPYVFDLRFDVEIIQATLYILHNRTDSDRYILDVNPKRGATADAFDALIALINPAYLRCAIAHTRALFWHYARKQGAY